MYLLIHQNCVLNTERLPPNDTQVVVCSMVHNDTQVVVQIIIWYFFQNATQSYYLPKKPDTVVTPEESKCGDNSSVLKLKWEDKKWTVELDFSLVKNEFNLNLLTITYDMKTADFPKINETKSSEFYKYYLNLRP